MKKFQTNDRHNDNWYERSQQRHDKDNENRFEKSQQRHDRYNENRYENPKQRHNRYNEDGYENPKQRHDRYNEDGYEKSQQRHNRYNENGYEKPQHKHHRYSENGYEIPPRQRTRTEEANRFSKYDSSGNRKDNSSDENMSIDCQQNPHQIEERPKPKISPQAYLKALKDLGKNKPAIKRIDEHKHLNKADNVTEQSGCKDYEKIRKGVHPLSPENKMLYPCSKNLNVGDEVSSLNDAKSECLKERKNSYTSEENFTRNTNVNNLQFANDSSLPFHQRSNSSLYESNLNQRRNSCDNEENYSRNTDVNNLQFVNENSLPFLQRSNAPLYESNLNQKRNSCNNEENYSRDTDVNNMQFVNESSLQFLRESSTSPYESNLNERSSSYIDEKTSSENVDVKNLQFDSKDPLQFLQRSSITSYESNENERDSYISEESSLGISNVNSLQFDDENQLPFLQKRNTSYESNQSNAYGQDMTEFNVYTHEVKTHFQSDKNITSNSSLRIVPQNNSSYDSPGFNMLRLTDLIHYNANLMQSQKLCEFASAVKSKILEKMDKFEYPEKEELQFLCEISDGDQSEKNQRIITSRTCRIVRNIIDKFPHLIKALDPPLPPPQIIVYRQTIPSSHVVTSSYCNDYEPAVLEIVQNSEGLTPASNYNTMPIYNVPAKFVVPKDILDSADSRNSINHISNSEVQKLSTNNAKSNCPINLSLITKENRNTDESSKQLAVLKIAQNSEVLYPATNYNTMPVCNVSKEILDSSDSWNSANHVSNFGAQKLPTNGAKSNNPINSSSITNENKNLDESSKHKSPINRGSIQKHEIPYKKTENFFTSLSFNDLLNYNVAKLHGHMVFDYAFTIKRHIIRKINLNQFRSPYKEKLHFLCQITDGTQREQNQKLINIRMHDLIISDYEARLKECPEEFLDEQSENDHRRKSH